MVSCKRGTHFLKKTTVVSRKRGTHLSKEQGFVQEGHPFIGKVSFVCVFLIFEYVRNLGLGYFGEALVDVSRCIMHMLRYTSLIM